MEELQEQKEKNEIAALVNLIVRKLGMGFTDSRGKDILVEMVVCMIQEKKNYKEMLEGMKFSVIGQVPLKNNLVCDIEGLSIAEICVVKAIEEVKSYEYGKSGKEAIKEWIEKIILKYNKSFSYQEIVRKSTQIGLNQTEPGTKIINSMAYRLYLEPEISMNNLYRYTIAKINPDTIYEWTSEIRNIPIEIVSGSNIHQKILKIDKVINEQMNSLIFKAACQSPKVEYMKQVIDIVKAVLNEE